MVEEVGGCRISPNHPSSRILGLNRKHPSIINFSLTILLLKLLYRPSYGSFVGYHVRRLHQSIWVSFALVCWDVKDIEMDGITLIGI